MSNWLWIFLQVLKSVVKLFVQISTPNYSMPWQMKRQQQVFGSGFIISGRRILTNGHVVAYQKSVSSSVTAAGIWPNGLTIRRRAFLVQKFTFALLLKTLMKHQLLSMLIIFCFDVGWPHFLDQKTGFFVTTLFRLHPKDSYTTVNHTIFPITVVSFFKT